MENCRKMKSTHKLAEEHPNPHNSISTKNIKHEQIESPLKKPEGIKKGKKSQKNHVIVKQEEPKPQPKAVTQGRTCTLCEKTFATMERLEKHILQLKDELQTARQEVPRLRKQEEEIKVGLFVFAFHVP